MENVKYKYILVKIDIEKRREANKRYYKKNKEEIIKKKIIKNKIERSTPEYKEHNRLYMKEYYKRKKANTLKNISTVLP